MTRPMSVPELSIIVISYNTREMTLACLASVYAETKTPFELIVVDNASPDGSAEAIAEAFPEAKLIAEAVANTSFQRLRAKEEQEGGFHERPDGCERFFRSGRSGEGREQLSAEQLLQLEEAFGSSLNRFGYSKKSD